MSLKKHEVPDGILDLWTKLGMSVEDVNEFYRIAELDKDNASCMMAACETSIILGIPIQGAIISAALYGYSLGLKAEKREDD